jgi:hypothetical protein
MTSRNAKRLEATAYHEAGHAVMAWSLRVRVDKVSICPEGDSLGHCSHEKIVRGRNPELDDSLRRRDQYEKDILVALAGGIAQRLFNCRSWRRLYVEGDWRKAARLAFNINGSSEQADAYLRWLEIRAKDTISSKRMWPLVKALARELLLKRKLSRDEVLAVIQRTLNELCPPRPGASA